LFVDTAYLNAVVNTRDQWHDIAVRWARRIVETNASLVTTEFILMEFANSLAAVHHRSQAIATIDHLRSLESLMIIPASSILFESGLDLYQRRMDKSWGMTDCISFVVMAEHGLDAALTTDGHFRQAGFRVLLVDDRER
jgi:predicted nucleic acid-binding protein